jgi:hypothetical protein
MRRCLTLTLYVLEEHTQKARDTARTDEVNQQELCVTCELEQTVWQKRNGDGRHAHGTLLKPKTETGGIPSDGMYLMEPQLWQEEAVAWSELRFVADGLRELREGRQIRDC